MQPEGEKPPTQPGGAQPAGRLKVTVQVPTLPRFTDPTVVVIMDGDTIESVRVDSRPTAPFGSGEGLHVTAWAVFVDSVRRGCVGVNVAAASLYVQTLCTSLDPDTSKWRLGGFRMPQFLAALRRAAIAAADAQSPFATAVLSLQTQIAAYLSARNLAPFVQVDLGAAQAIGGGEPAALLVLREYETEGEGYTEAELCKAIWTLLDTRTINFVLVGHPDEDTLPGWQEGDTPGWLVWKMVSTHLIEISTAYPVAFNACGLDDTDLVTEFIAGFTADLPDDIIAMLPGMQATTGLAPLGWARRRGGTRRCGVSLTIALTDPLLTITSVKFGSRPTTLLNTDGHHLTAWVSFTRLVTKTVKNKPAAVALTDMIALAQQVTVLPTFPALNIIPGAQDPKLIFQTAYTWFTEVQVLAAQTNHDISLSHDPQEAPLVLQDLCAAYLALRNALPLAAVNYGAPANNHGEQNWAAALDTWEAGGLALADRGAVQQQLWQLLDIGKLSAVYTTTILKDTAPGSDPDPLVRVASAIKVHLITMTATWPSCCQHAVLDGQFSIEAAIAAADDINILNWPHFLGLIGGVQMGQGDYPHPKGIGNAQDDPHYADGVAVEDVSDSDLDFSEPDSDEDDPILIPGTKKRSLGSDKNPKKKKEQKKTGEG
jgi:hypothetical protein